MRFFDSSSLLVILFSMIPSGSMWKNAVKMTAKCTIGCDILKGTKSKCQQFLNSTQYKELCEEEEWKESHRKAYQDYIAWNNTRSKSADSVYDKNVAIAYEWIEKRAEMGTWPPIGTFSDYEEIEEMKNYTSVYYKAYPSKKEYEERKMRGERRRQMKINMFETTWYDDLYASYGLLGMIISACICLCLAGLSVVGGVIVCKYVKKFCYKYNKLPLNGQVVSNNFDESV